MGNSKSGLNPKTVDDLSQHTNFSEAEIKQWYKGFKKDCPKGTLDKKEFKKVYANFFPDGDSTAFAEYAFNTFDSDKDGTINFAEFLTGLSVTSRGSSIDKLKWAFDMYDIDDSGTISREELLEIMKAIYKLNTDHSFLGEDEKTAQQRTDKIFKTVDVNNDGQLTLDEFVKGVTTEPSLLRMIQGK